MRRLLSWLSVCAVLVCSLPVTAAAQTADSQNPPRQALDAVAGDQPAADGEEAAETTGDFSLTLRFACPERLDSIGARQIRAALLDGQEKEVWGVTLTPELSGESGQELADGFSAQTVYLNEYGDELTTESLVSFFQAEIQGLALNQDYRVRLTGDGYADYTSEAFSLTTFSRQLVVNTASMSFSLGDVNGDKQVDARDLEVMPQALDGSYAAADINRDGVVDITDIAYVHRQTNVKLGEAEFFDTRMIAANVAAVDSSAIMVEGGTAQDLLRSGTEPVTVKAQAGQQEITIPVDFQTGTDELKVAQIAIVSPQTNGAVTAGEAVVTYVEDGAEYTEKLPFSNEQPEGVHPLFREAGQSRVVISLGKQVAVKRVVITVTKVQGQGADPLEFAVIDEIQFLKDIVPDNPVTDSAVPKGVQADAGDSQVSLKWTPVRNVDGYLVVYHNEDGKISGEAATEIPEITVKGLKNLETYYFTVYSTSGDWKSAPSQEVTAVPEPASVPDCPGNVRLEPGDKALVVRWGKTKNATGYNVYYKVSDAEGGFEKANQEALTDLQFTISGLVNGTDYTVYATAVNAIGESKPSVYAQAAPKSEEIIEPKIPTLHRIDNSTVAEVKMENPNNVAKDQYPDGFSVNNVLDGDYSTHWTARAWWESSGFTFTFDEGVSHTMDYLAYVPRLDGAYKNSLSQYTVKAWDEEGNQVLNMASSGPSLDNQSRSSGYAILTFPKTENIHKIYVSVSQWNGSPTTVSLSEIAFYNYYSLDDRIKALFADSSYTSLAQGVTESQIAELEAEINDTEGYFVDRDILKDEIAIARGLYEGDAQVLGKVLDGIQSRKTAGDLKVVNTFQPMGVVANAGKKVVIYAQIPEGEKVSIVPTQYYAEAISWAGGQIALQNGRNVITIPQLTTIAGEKGGALYLQYAGDHPEEIKLQIRGEAVSIPVLELSDLGAKSEQEAKAVIGEYVTELTDYYENKLYGKMGGNPQTYVRNSTEISLPNVLLSIPASEVYKALKNAGSQEAKVDMLYQNANAWQELLYIMYRTHGIDDITKEHSRQNIRYARMTGGAFMYASGAHIGIGFGSAAGMVQGKPVSVTGEGNANRLFGWGIAHEIGHVLDTLGKAEITNNIYSLYGQTYDGLNNTGTSRLEGGKYDQIFQKTAVGAKGAANDVFVSLGMYWQLHLAYDGAEDNFYNLLNKAYREGKGKDFKGDEKFAVAASEIAGRNLTEFFTRWGVELGEQAKAQMAAYPEETRQIWYLNDASRRKTLAGSASAAAGTPVVATQAEGREITLSVSGLTGTEDLQGYEISRNGKTIAFTKEPSYVDVIGSANNISIQYTVKAVDVLGNVVGTGKSEPFMLSVNRLIDRSFWKGEKQADGSWLITFSGANMPEVSGIYVKGSASGQLTAAVRTVSSCDTVSGNQPGVYTVTGNDATDGQTFIQVSENGSSYETVLNRELSVLKEDMAYLFFRGEDDGSVGFYQAQSMIIRNLPEGMTLDDIEFIAYPGDSITLNEAAVGILSDDLPYGDGEGQVIPKGSMIVTGTYSGDPVYNTIRVNGRYETYSGDSLEGTTVERPVNGEVILFAPVTEGRDMAEIHDGIWIFVPDVEKEQELAEGTCSLSVLPSQIMAELYRTDDPNQADSKRLVSNTLWLAMPDQDSMPEIVIE